MPITLERGVENLFFQLFLVEVPYHTISTDLRLLFFDSCVEASITITAAVTIISSLIEDDSGTYEIFCLMLHDFSEVIVAQISITVSSKLLKHFLAVFGAEWKLFDCAQFQIKSDLSLYSLYYVEACN